MSNRLFKLRPASPAWITAVQWTGDNLDEIKDFVGSTEEVPLVSLWASVSRTPATPNPPADLYLFVAKSETWCILHVGSWVIVEPDGSGFYPCTDDVFEAKYIPATPARSARA